MYVGFGIHYKLERQSQILVNNSFLHAPINLLEWLDMKYISIVKSILNPSTIAPNELDFYKESMLKMILNMQRSRILQFLVTMSYLQVYETYPPNLLCICLSLVQIIAINLLYIIVAYIQMKLLVAQGPTCIIRLKKTKQKLCKKFLKL
jgi:hypothetical protein